MGDGARAHTPTGVFCERRWYKSRMSGQRERTAGLWFLSIAALLFGLMGCCGGALGSWGLVNAQQQQARMQQMQGSGMNTDFIEAMQPDAMVTGIQYAALGVNGIVAILLFVVAIFIFTWNPNTTKIGSILLGVVAVLTVIITAIELYGSWVQMEKLSEVMGGMEGPGSMAAADGIASFGFGMTLCITGGWQGAKMLIAMWGLFYLRKPQIAELFGGGGNIGPRGDY